MRKLIAIAFSLMIASAAFAADAETDRRELAFKILSAKVEKMDRPLQTRKGKYDVALVLRIAVDRAEWKNLPPSVETFLYLGDHELPPFANLLDGPQVVITFHDPDWQTLKGGEPMVLTAEHGDPVNNPDKYAGYPRFDPGMIQEK